MFIHNTPAAYYGRSIKITLEILEYRRILEIFTCWSIRVKYCENFIKTIIKWLEKHQNLEINSRWYELIDDLASWPATISFGDYLMKRIHLLENKRIIELGAGSGLLGFTLLNFSKYQLDENMKIDELDWNQYSKENNHHNYFDCVLAAC
ncbi:unnamed protein product [Adineta steineri]|uniref:Uncharacterized protein n=1 Tax=Adineta steineri TaxID=433720 RepID=A0A819V2Q9_9BILA|nr:unnamed protein product [Adineta steineri]